MKILLTGGAGFIGSAVVRHLINFSEHEVINVDKLTYAGNLQSLSEIEGSKRYSFELADICNMNKMINLFQKYKPDIVMHLAAESHVDRSINNPNEVIHTNIIGTYNLLEASRKFWSSLNTKQKNNFRFHHISTDEVYGDLEDSKLLFKEDTPYCPSSPYSATKASSDHLVRAWGRTYGIPIIVTNCSNNYGPFQFPEKLIPLSIINCLQGKSIPIYGKGTQIRDWLYVEDHARALVQVVMKGSVGETYNIGGNNQKKNIEVVKMLCSLLQELNTDQSKRVSRYEDLITYIDDRPGHDIRYAIDASKIQKELGWVPKETFESGLRKTVNWYLANKRWFMNILDGS